MDNLFLTVNIIFIPVRQGLTKTTDHNHKFFLIKIVVPAQMNTVYFLKNKNECFFRQPEGNVKLNLKEVRRLTVFLSEQRFLLAKDT